MKRSPVWVVVRRLVLIGVVATLAYFAGAKLGSRFIEVDVYNKAGRRTALYNTGEITPVTMRSTLKSTNGKSTTGATSNSTDAKSDSLKDATVDAKPRDLKLSVPNLIAWGFETPHGIAYFAGTIYVSDAWESIDKFGAQKGPIVSIPASVAICPSDECEPVEHRGLALDTKGNVVVADYHRLRLTSRMADGRPQPAILRGQALDTVSGVASGQDGDWFVTEEGTLPQAGEPEQRGRLLRITHGEQEVLDTSLHHPTAVALSADGSELFVSDTSARGTQWLTYSRDDNCQWKRDGALGMDPAGSGSTLEFHGIAAAPEGHVFAAGMQGIYIFSTDPNTREHAFEGRIDFGASVGALAFGDASLYAIVGRDLYHIGTSLSPLSVCAVCIAKANAKSGSAGGAHATDKPAVPVKPVSYTPGRAKSPGSRTASATSEATCGQESCGCAFEGTNTCRER